MHIRAGIKNTAHQLEIETDETTETIIKALETAQTGKKNYIQIKATNGDNYLLNPQEISFIHFKTTGTKRVGFVA